MRLRSINACVLVALTLVLASGASADPPKDVLYMSAGASSPDGAVPISAGKVSSWAYPSFCLGTGTFAQTFPVSVQLTDGNGTSGQQVVAHFVASGTLKAYATVPADVTLTDDGTVVDAGTVSIDATGLAPGAYALKVRVTASGVFITRKSLNVYVVVGSGCLGSSIAFYTDDQLNDLVDCDGLDVSVPTGGTFKIVPKGVGASEVSATQPASFVYNFIWSNASVGTVNAQLDLASTGFAPTGSDAAHALAFDTAGFTADLTNFQLVNATGTSCGTTGPCAIAVGVGKTLWVTWAGTWTGLGGLTEGIATSCPGDAAITESSTLTNTDGNVPLAVSAGSATGYVVACPSGDVDGSGSTDVVDVLYLINYLFAGGPAPVCGTGNANADPGTDIIDVLYLINYLFAGGPGPV